jgi:hypothetical protein
VQAPRAHRFDFCRVRLHGVVHHALPGALGEKVGEWLEHVLIDGGILDRRIGENQRRGIFELLRIGRHIGDEVTVDIAIERVQLTAVRAFLGDCARTARQDRGKKRIHSRPRKMAPQIGHFVLPA